MVFYNAANKVPEHQRVYQAAYKHHTRIWKINPRSKWYMTPYLVLMWGSVTFSLYGVGRKILGYNSYFGGK